MDYRAEQQLNQNIVQGYLHRCPAEERLQIRDMCQDYLQFRRELARFQSRYLDTICSAACFQQQRSACCNKDGIITFFADLVVNAVVSAPSQLQELMTCLQHPRKDMKCIYLGPMGCRWQMKPIVCEMFVCDRAKQQIFDAHAEAWAIWDAMKKKELSFRWPDRPVLFDEIESRFMAAGVRSSLMYLHISPGLIRVKKKAGLI
ncbi:MAG: hypothetical protein PVJ53_05790 [Desulfobacterales bacterium]|jgi:hypothetical protein